MSVGVDRKASVAWMVQGLGAFGVHVAAVDRQRHVLAITDGFVTYCPAFIVDAASRLALTSQDATRRLTRALATAFDDGAFQLALDTRENGPFVAHLRRGSDCAVLVSLASAASADTAPDPAILQALYGLTPAEARLASMVASSASICDSATACGVAVKTARSTLERVYAKTGVRRQVDLARLLAPAAPRGAARRLASVEPPVEAKLPR